MTEKEMLLKLIGQGKIMRKAKTNFFQYKGKVDKDHRIKLITEAKVVEREFDNLLHNFEQLVK